jgi:hypothetical protein
LSGKFLSPPYHFTHCLISYFLQLVDLGVVFITGTIVAVVLGRDFTNRRINAMKTIATMLLLGSLAMGGCEFAAGAATGALATGAGYEINSKRQMDRLEEDYRRERISRREYERRREQIDRGSIIY